MRLKNVVNYKSEHKKQFDSFLKESFTDILVNNIEDEENRHNALVGLAYDTMDFYDLYDAIDNETGNPQADILNALADQTDEELVNGLIYYVNNNDYDNEEKVHLAKELKKITGKDYFNALNIVLTEKNVLKEAIDKDAESFKDWFSYFLMLEEINPKLYYEIHDKYDVICAEDTFWDTDADYDDAFKTAKPKTQKALLKLIKEYPVEKNPEASDEHIIKECLKMYSEMNRLKEDIKKVDFNYIYKKRETDPEFKKITDTKLKDLPEKCKFSFEEEVWKENQNRSLFGIYSKSVIDGSLANKADLFISEKDGEPLGWVVLYCVNHKTTIYCIKFGSFYPEDFKRNTEFCKQLIDYLKENLPKYRDVHWTASLENPFTKHYINIIKKNNGAIYFMPSEPEYADFCLGTKLSGVGIEISGAELVDIKTIEDLKNRFSTKMNESCTLKVFNKEGKQIDNQPGFKSSSEAYAFLDNNDDKYPAGYTYKVLYNESKEDKSKELLTECCLKIFNKHKKLNENLAEKDFDYVLSKRETDPEFKKITDTKLKDLPEKCKFSFGEDFWEDCQDDSLFEIYERAYVAGSLRAKSKLILSENNEEPLGWVLLNFGETNKIITSIKFGSFYPNDSLKNREFLQQLLAYISQELKNYDRVCWFASRENPFTRHYINILKKYNGSVNYMPGDLNYLEFVIGKNFYIENALFGKDLDNLKTVKDIIEALNKKNGYSKRDLKESEEAPSREELNAKIRQYMINSMKDEEWEPEDKELWKSIDWEARNYEDYPVEEDSFDGDVYYYDRSGKHVEPGKFIKYIRSNPNFPPYYSATPDNDSKGTWGMYDGRKRGKYNIHDRRESWDLNRDFSD